jgi:prepilin-type N-terminal cleavage/methylation domain-containing protein
MRVTTSGKRRNGQAGFTLVDMLFVIALIGLLSSLAVPGLMRAKGAAQASSAVGTLQVFNSAELSFAIGCGGGFYAPDLTTLGTVPPGSIDGFLAPELSGGLTIIKSGYLFSLAGTPMTGAPQSCNGLGVGQASAGYAAIADSLDPDVASARFFGTNTDGVVYESSTTISSTMPETGAPPGATLLR